MLNIIDQGIINFISKIHNPFLDKIIIFFTNLGDNGIVWIVLIVVLLGMKKTRKTGLMILGAVILAMIFTNFLKNNIQRERPYEYLNLIPLVKSSGTNSFPSSHTSVAFAVLGVYSYFKLKYRWVVSILAFGIGFSRIYLNLHYFTDVLAGAVLGLMTSYLVVYACSQVAKEMRKRKLRVLDREI